MIGNVEAVRNWHVGGADSIRILRHEGVAP